MAIIAIFSGSYCHGPAVAEGVARKLGYRKIENELIDETTRQYKFPEDKLKRAIFGPPPLFGNFTKERNILTAYLRAVLADCIKENDIVYCGFTAHLMPRTVSHILRVCVIGNFDFRVKTAVKTERMSEKEARRRIKKDDEVSLQWTQYLFESPPFSEDLYDVIVPMQSDSIEEAVDLICDNARKEAVQATPRSQHAVEDFSLEARVRIALLERGHDELEVTCNEGNTRIVINKSVVRLDPYMAEVKAIAASVPGVKSARAEVGPKYHPPNIMYNVEFELPRKVLLVDDEKEFVHTLSERLQTRSLESSIVYDGEQALSFVENEEPEVMVLDLKMPGIDGIEVLRRVKMDHPDVEVIILTGHGSEKEQALAMELGAFAYLNKPVNIDVLAKTMKDAYKKISEKKASRGRSAKNDGE